MIRKILSSFLSLVVLNALLGVAALTVPALAAQPGVPALNVSGGQAASYNWAGYVADNATYTGIGASWVVPHATSSGLAADATWVGIGGITGHDLIQVGTQAIFDGNSVSYQAWYELLPNNSQDVFSVSPGDAITAAIIQQSANQWSVSINDTTSGQNYQTSLSYTSSENSAEWIEEMPSMVNGFIPLDNFGTVAFTNAWTTRNGSQLTLAGSSAQELTMVNSLNQVLAQPSALGADGASFSVTRTAAIPNQPAAGTRGGAHRRIGVGISGFQPNTHPSGVPNRFGQRFSISLRGTVFTFTK